MKHLSPLLRFYLFLFIPLCTPVVYATDACDVRDQSTAFPHEKGLLWEIQAPDGTVSYLFGTMHSSDSLVLNIAKQLPDKVFSEPELLLVELDLDNIDPMQLMPHLIMTDTTLPELLSPEDYQMVRQFFEEEIDNPMLPFDMLEQIKPVFLTSFLEIMNRFGLHQGNNNGPLIQDEYIARKFNEMDKGIIGLEKLEDQLKALDAIPLKTQADGLAETIRQYKAGENPYKVIADLYVNGNLPELYRMISSDDLMSGMLEEKMIVRRNHNMKAAAMKYLSEQPALIAVGALHLPGPDGLLKLLCEEGFEVRNLAE